MIVSRADLADIFDVALTTVDVWVREGLPVDKLGGRGKAYEFDTALAHKWLVSRALEEKRHRGNRFGEKPPPSGGAPSGQIMSIDTAHRRRESARARREEINLAKDMDMVVTLDEIERILSDEIAAARARILAIPIKFRPQIEMYVNDKDQVKKIIALIDLYIREALAEIKTASQLEDPILTEPSAEEKNRAAKGRDRHGQEHD